MTQLEAREENRWLIIEPIRVDRLGGCRPNFNSHAGENNANDDAGGTEDEDEDENGN
ncbi:hypothetical protein TIFTF001_026186 [Ficus carica]|uniref:Uncharacterized protein n=1 Tax=Ficus carica TaxID=3494 RepID=A0AA88DKR8_FICCA|nr:hypothetical protein TIFTF001_026186 [Ficus carica]